MDTMRIARELLDALDAGGTVLSVVERHPGFGWDEGYAVAGALLRLRRARGERTVGRKIGFTNRNIWAEYRATAPIWAHVYDRTVVHAAGNAAVVSLKGSARPRLEPEIAIRLKAPLPAATGDPVGVLEAVEWIAPSFEIVDCHFADWQFGPADAAADFSLHWRLVLGTPLRFDRSEISAIAEQMRDCRVMLSRNGEVVDRGVGANALGHPASALAHLADLLSRQPQFDPLAPGEIITTGTLTAAMPVRAGERWASGYDGIALAGIALTFVD